MARYFTGMPTIGMNNAQLGRPMMMPAVFFDDFIEFGAVDFSLTADAAKWIVAGTNAAVTVSTNIAHSAADGGKLFLKTAASSGDEQFIQLNGASFAFASSTTAPRACEWQTKVVIDTITTSNQIFGMFATGAVTGTTDPIDTQAVGFGFVVASGALQYQYKTSATTVASSAFSPAITVAAAQVLELRISWDGVDTLTFYKDGVKLLSVGLPTFTATALSPAMGIDTASAVAKTFKCDYVYCCTEAPAAGR